jgi:hypothetical protein
LRVGNDEKNLKNLNAHNVDELRSGMGDRIVP